VSSKVCFSPEIIWSTLH